MNTACSVDGCGAPVRTRGMCHNYYEVWRRANKDQIVDRSFKSGLPHPTDPCLTEGCPRKASARGMCKYHYEQWREANPDQIRVVPDDGLTPVRRHYWRNAEAQRAERRAYSQRPEAKVLAAAAAREYRKKHPGKTRGADRVWMDTLLKDPCVYCGGTATEIDHITPRSRGGGNGNDNLAPVCLPCNRSKKDHSLILWLLGHKVA